VRGVDRDDLHEDERDEGGSEVGGKTKRDREKEERLVGPPVSDVKVSAGSKRGTGRTRDRQKG
jgi:hypothetical protein